MFVFKAAVVGAGTMGGEIAQAIAAADIPVVLKDIDQKFVDHGLEKAREVTKGQLDRLVAKEKLTQEQADARLDEVMGRIEGTTDYSAFGDVDFVIEAAPERMEIKQPVFAELDEVTPGHAILASNTSSLSITEMGEATLRPDKVVGFHFFYPASVMPLLEIVEGEETSPETIQAAFNFAQAIRKQPIICARGARLRRQPHPQLRGRRALARAGGAGPLDQEDRREGRRARSVAPMGPFILTDLLGLDTVLHVAEHLHESYGDDSFYVHEGMQKLVADGKLGRQVGRRGLLQGRRAADRRRRRARTTSWSRSSRSRRSSRRACCSRRASAPVREIDLGMMAGAGLDPRRGLFPPFMKADLEGLDVVLEKLEKAEESYGERFAPPTRPQAPRRPGPPRRRSPARASTPTRSPTRASRPTRSSSRPAATSRSPGSPTCR